MEVWNGKVWIIASDGGTVCVGRRCERKVRVIAPGGHFSFTGCLLPWVFFISSCKFGGEALTWWLRRMQACEKVWKVLEGA